MEKYGRAGQATDDNVTRHMRFARWITKATDVHAEDVIFNSCPRQPMLREQFLILLYTCIAFHVISDAMMASLLKILAES
jgi:hypothetical protein